MRAPASRDETDPLSPALVECAEVHSLIQEGHELGCLSGADVAVALRDVEVTPAQIEELLLWLTDMGIEITDDGAHAAADTVAEASDDAEPRWPASSTFPRSPPAATPCGCTSTRWARCRC